MKNKIKCKESIRPVNHTVIHSEGIDLHDKVIRHMT